MARARSDKVAHDEKPGLTLLGLRGRRLWGVGVLLTVIAIVAAVAAVQSGGGSGGQTADFRIVAYQGADVLGGSEVNFSSLLGKGKPVVLNFWAGACPPCRAEMPSLQRVYEENAGAFTLIGVDIGPFVNLGSHDDAQRLLQELQVTYPAGYATSSDPVRTYNVLGMPTTVFFAADGRQVSKHTGLITEDQFRAAVAALIAGQA